MNKYLITLLAGTLSGVLSTFTLEMQPMLAPGICFGVVTALLFWHVYKTKWPILLIWMIISILSWYVAVWVYMLTFTRTDVLSPSTLDEVLAYLLAGTIGALMLATVRKVIGKYGLLMVLGVATAGGLLGLLMYFINSLQPTEVMMYFSFAIWQIGISLMLILPNTNQATPVYEDEQTQNQ